MPKPLLTIALCLMIVQPLWAQKNVRNNKQDEKRENQRVADAQRSVRDKQGHVNDVEQKLRGFIRSSARLDADVVKARTHWRETREQVADDMAKAAGIDAAQSKLKDAKAALAEFSKPLLEKLHQSDVWLKARQAASDAKAKAEKVREDIALGDEERQAKLSELARLVMQPDELDKQAILATSDGQRLNEEVNQALAAIAKIRQSIPDDKVDSNPKVVQAKQAITKAEQEVKQNADSIRTQRGQLQKAQQELVQSRQKLQQAQSADARDKNRK